MIKVVRALPQASLRRLLFGRLTLNVNRTFKTVPDDPKYVFSKPPKPPPSSSTFLNKDGTHFFTPPNSNGQDDRKMGESRDGVKEDIESLGQAIASRKRRDRKRLILLIFLGVFGTFLGYTIGYKVIYLREQSFIPVFPSSKVRKLSDSDRRRIDVKQVEKLAGVRVLEQLSQHPMIRDDYGVPLLDDHNEMPKVQDFKMWCEDLDPCVTGIVIEPNDARATSHEWYRVPFLFKWRITHRPVSLSENLNDFLNRVGLTTTDIFQIIAPENVYGSFKYEFPIQGDNHSMHIWFLGEMKLDKDTLIVFKGKFHIDARLEQIDLLRRENNKLVRYILYKDAGK